MRVTAERLQACLCARPYTVLRSLSRAYIAPLNEGEQVEAADGGQRVDDMRAQEGVDVVWCEFATVGSVLGPVCHVTHQFATRD